MTGTNASTTLTNTVGGTLYDRLTTRGCEFDFFQAVWLLERFAARGLPVGERGPVAQEPFRFRAHTSLGFPATDIKRIAALPGTEDGVPFFRFDVTFMGLYGVSTPLPVHYAVDVLRSVERHDSSRDQVAGADESRAPQADETGDGLSPVRDFLDIFHHRLISLFYRSWLKYRFDKAYGLRGHDVITDYLLWLIGCPRGCDESTFGVSPIHMLRYAGALTHRPKSAATLEGMLVDYWKDLPVEVNQCVGRWVPVSPSDMNSVGSSNCTLGVDLTVGEEVYDISSTFSVSVGPVDWETYLQFLPDGESFSQTRSVVELYCADPLSFTIEMKLHTGEVPEMQLTSDDRAGRLGYTSWVRTEEVPATSVTLSSASVKMSEPLGREAGAIGGRHTYCERK